jgi:hypothetical protein
MTATRLTEIDDGHIALETFDFRSEFSLGDFRAEIDKRFGVVITRADAADPLAPGWFDWRGQRFQIAWDDANGSHVRAAMADRAQLEAMALIITWGEESI